MAIVYTHIRKDKNQVFYVGIGKDISRAYSKSGRSNYWHNIVNKYGYDVLITHNDICKEEACSIEKYLICFYGRKDLNLGPLVNLTDGGESNQNLSPVTIEIMRYNNTGERNPMYGKRGTMTGMFGPLNPNYGKKHTEEAKALMRELKKGMFVGKNNPMYGKSHSENTKQIISRKAKDRYIKYGSKKTKRVINTISGFIYNSVKDVADEFGVGVTTVRSWLNGWNKNPTSLKYLN